MSFPPDLLNKQYKLTRFPNSGTSKYHKPYFASRRGHIVIIICLRQFIRPISYARGSNRGFDQHLELLFSFFFRQIFGEVTLLSLSSRSYFFF